VVKFPIDHPNCYFHRFPWPETKTEKVYFWFFFFMVAPLVLLILGYQHRISHIFAFGYNYGFILQPLRILKKIPLSLFIRGDTKQVHEYKKIPRPIIAMERLMEGAGMQGCRFYGVSNKLTMQIPLRHKIFSPLVSETFTNNIEKAPKLVQQKSSYISPLKLGCVGILEKGKNQALLIEMMSRFESIQANLFIFGIGPDEGRLRRQVETARLNDRVFMPGWVNSEKIWPKIDILVIPSLHEGCPNAVLEAMENNIPVLASKIPEHEEILPSSQLIQMDSFSWFQAIQGILHDIDNALTKMRAAQNPFALSLYFNWDNEIVKRILQ
jgi:glycosyltransferase involved in cell wall biosynthesis